MKARKPNEILEKLIKDNPELFACKESIEKAFKIASECYSNNGKILICGNGGSASDSEHIVGELMKGFMIKRPISADKRNRIIAEFPEEGIYLSNKFQGALPEISLVSQTYIYSAYINDVEPDMVFAQQVYGYVDKNDVIIGLSTSGNSRNIVNAMKVGKAFGAKS